MKMGINDVWDKVEQRRRREDTTTTDRGQIPLVQIPIYSEEGLLERTRGSEDDRFRSNPRGRPKDDLGLKVR